MSRVARYSENPLVLFRQTLDVSGAFSPAVKLRALEKLREEITEQIKAAVTPAVREIHKKQQKSLNLLQPAPLLTEAEQHELKRYNDAVQAYRELLVDVENQLPRPSA